MPRRIIPYRPYLKPIAKRLRNNMTLSEILLWNELKNHKMMGFDFDRQRPIDDFIVDFYCKDLNLVIEVDGNSHDGDENLRLDIIRQRRVESFGIHFLRFDDREIKHNIDGVLHAIKSWIEEYNL